MTTVNAGARLDRLPISAFHYRIFWLVGAGMFFDGYDLYVAGGVLASAVQTKFSTLPQNLQFISLTFVGMTLGALITGFVGDKFGRRFTYQFNLMIFGLASLAAAFAPNIHVLNGLRFDRRHLRSHVPAVRRLYLGALPHCGAAGRQRHLYMFGRGATIVTPLIIVALFRAYGVGGVLLFMIGLLVVQIVVVWAWGIKPARCGLETLSNRTEELSAQAVQV